MASRDALNAEIRVPRSPTLVRAPQMRAIQAQTSLDPCFRMSPGVNHVWLIVQGQMLTTGMAWLQKVIAQ